MTSPTTALAFDLIARDSTTPADAGCQEAMISRLEPLGFSIHRLRYGAVTNLWAQRGQHAPLFVFAGHTDVVPSGPCELWHNPPFAPAIRDGFLYGRGAADMKGSLAAMITATERFLDQYPQHRGAIGFLITSDEEGPAVDGTAKVMEFLKARGTRIDWCLIGEPTSQYRAGDVIKNGRRGSLTGHLRVLGVQGHVAYPHLAENPIHGLAPALAELCAQTWDQGSEHFPATTFQISNIHGGTGADNVIPGHLDLIFNFRHSTASTATDLQQRVQAILDRHSVRYDLRWILSGQPFLTPAGELVDATRAAIRDTLGIEPQLSTSGGTSDGRFIAPTGAQVLELGPINATIHKLNECVKVQELDELSTIYQRILERLLGPS